MKLRKLMQQEYARAHSEAVRNGAASSVSRVFFRPGRELVVNFNDGLLLDASDCTIAQVTVSDILADDWAMEHEGRFSSTLQFTPPAPPMEALLDTGLSASTPCEAPPVHKRRMVGSLAWAKQQAAEGHRVAIYTPAGALQWLVEPGTPDLVFQFNGHYRRVASLHEVPVRGWGDIIDVGKLEEEVRRVYHYLKTEDHAFTFLQSAYVVRDSVVKAIEDTMLRCGESLIATPAEGFILVIPIDGNRLRHSAPLPCSLERVHHAGNGVPAAAFDSIGDAVLYLVVRHQYLPLEFDPV